MTYGIRSAADRVCLTLGDGCLNLGNWQLGSSSLHATGRIQRLCVLGCDLGRWDRLHRRISDGASLHRILDIVILGLSCSCRWLASFSSAVYGIGALCAINSRKTGLDGCRESACHARVRESIGEGNELATGLGHCDHLEEAGGGLARSLRAYWD